MFWVALNAGSKSGTCAVVGTPTVRLAYSSAKKSRHILETHWLGFSMSVHHVVVNRGSRLKVAVSEHHVVVNKEAVLKLRCLFIVFLS